MRNKIQLVTKDNRLYFKLWNSFTTLIHPVLYHYRHPSFPRPEPVATNDRFAVCIVLPFREHRTVEMTLCVAFSDQLFPLAIHIYNFSMLFCCLMALFSLLLSSVQLYGCSTVCPLTPEKDILIGSNFWQV